MSWHDDLYVFFVVNLNEMLNKQSSWQWFEIPWCSSGCNVLYFLNMEYFQPHNHNSVRCRCLQNIHNRNPIDRPLGWAIGYLLWEQALINVLPQSLQRWMYYHVLLHHAVTALNCIWIGDMTLSPMFSLDDNLAVQECIWFDRESDIGFTHISTHQTNTL